MRPASLLIVSSFVLLIFASSCREGRDAAGPTATATPIGPTAAPTLTVPRQSLRVLNPSCVWDEDRTGQITRCSGRVENTGPDDLDNITLRVRFVDFRSEPFRIAHLAAGESAPYDITVPGARSPKTGSRIVAEDSQGQPIVVVLD